MIKIEKLNETDWYLEEVRKIFSKANSKDKIGEQQKQFLKKVEPINKELKDFGLNLSDFSEQKGRTLFEELVVASYSDLEKIYNKINGKTENVFWKKIKDKGGQEKHIYIGGWNDLYIMYGKFSSKNLNKMIVNKFNVKCCPYCNENFTINRGKKAMAQLDHFYPRKYYPIFALCLYNLVPACYSCNHNKSSNSIGVSPHNQDYNFDALKISYKPLSADWINDSNQIEINFQYSEDKESKLIKKNIKEMGIEDSYKFHGDYVQEILKKAQIYNKDKIQEMQFSFPNLFSNEEEILRIIFGNYIENTDLGKRPLSKLTRDILKELNIT